MKKGRRYRWSLRTLFLVVAVIAVIFALTASRFRAGIQQRKTIESLQAQGVLLSFDEDWRSRLSYLFLSSRVRSIAVKKTVGHIDTELLHTFSKVEAPGSFAFTERNIDRETLYAVAQQPNLTSVSFWECEIQPQALAGLNESHGLRGISCRYRTELDESHFRNLIEFSQLDTLILIDNSLNATETTLLGQADHLRLLHLAGANFSPNAIEHLSGLKNLEKLYLIESTVTDDELDRLEFPLLEVLDLSFTGITNDGLQHLGNFPRLRILDLEHTTVDDEGMQYLDQLKDLEILHLGETNVTPEMMRSLRSRGINVPY